MHWLDLRLDPEAPDPFFNHAIVSVELTAGKYVLMDPTDEHTRNLLPSYDCDQSYLVCRPEGENLMTSAIEPPEEHMMEVKTTGVLTAAGALTAAARSIKVGRTDFISRSICPPQAAGRKLKGLPGMACPAAGHGRLRTVA